VSPFAFGSTVLVDGETRTDMKIGVTGHQNIPSDAEPFVREGIKRIVTAWNDGSLVGISSLAIGADQLFASIILSCGGGLHVIIPSNDYESTFPPEDLERFRKLLDKTDVVETLDYRAPTETSFLAAGHRIVDSSDLMIAVWDGLPAKGKGGTADVVHYANEQGRKVEVIWPKGVSR
jgi:hypothetical protein